MFIGFQMSSKGEKQILKDAGVATLEGVDHLTDYKSYHMTTLAVRLLSN